MLQEPAIGERKREGRAAATIALHSYLAMIKLSAPPPAPVIPALPSTADTAPAVAEAAAAFVPVFFFVEELFCVFRVEVVLLTGVPEADPE